MIGLSAIAFWILTVVSVLCDSDPCATLGEVRVCNETQYETYRECVEETKLLREKRQAQCPNFVVTAQPYLNQESLAFHQVSGDVVMPSVQVIPAFQSVKTVEPIESNDIPEYGSRSAEYVRPTSRRVLIQGDDDEEREYHVPTNITTIFRLTNVVNNTNLINTPVHVNTTNVNNIHIYANITEGEPTPTEEKCCTAVRPKSCHASTQGFKCHHKKFHTCGPQCTSEVVHVQRRKRCDSSGNCKEKIAYVPQPEKPTCVYIDQWPYVACGKPANMKIICDGCYDHYGTGSQNGQIQPHCRSCYDDGFDQGPMYRRGPFLRQFHYHEPPCYVTGTCPMQYGDCGYGCYGHDMIDPAWGPPSSYDPNMDDHNTEFYEQDPQLTNDTEADWGVPAHKCTVVTDDNTISVQNCTETVDNQYAAAPSKYPYYKEIQFPAHSRQRKPVHKTKQTIRKQNMVIEDDDVDPSSGDGSFVVESDTSFIHRDHDEYDYSF